MFYKFKKYVIPVVTLIVGLLFGIFNPFSSSVQVQPTVTNMFVIKQDIYIETNITEYEYSDDMMFGVAMTNADIITSELVQDNNITKTFVIETQGAVQNDFNLVLIRNNNAELYELNNYFRIEMGRHLFVYNNSTATFIRRDLEQSDKYNVVHNLNGINTENEVIINGHVATNDGIFVAATNTSENYSNQYINFKVGDRRLNYRVHKVFQSKDNRMTMIVYELEPSANQETVNIYIKVGAGADDVAKQKSLVIPLTPTQILE